MLTAGLRCAPDTLPMNKMIAITISAGAVTAAVRLIVSGNACPIIPPPAATRTRKKVPSVSEKSRRHSCRGFWKSVIGSSTSACSQSSTRTLIASSLVLTQPSLASLVHTAGQQHARAWLLTSSTATRASHKYGSPLMAPAEPGLLELMRAIAASDAHAVSRLLDMSPALVLASIDVGATRH